MSFVLGATTLPNPIGFEREFIETSTTNTTLNGRVTKDLRNRKERFVLSFQRLTTTEVNTILTEYNDQTTKNFSVSEDNLTISATPVHIEIQSRDYVKGGEFRTDLQLILTEEV